MRKILYSILCTLAVLLASCTKENKLIALDGRMETSAILSSDEVKTFVQNFDGRMWIGTSYGLNLYDGQSFTSFYFNNNDTTTIPDNNILKLFRDRQNRIWIGTHHGLALYDGNGRFRRFHPDKGEDNDVREIVQLSDGRIIAKSGTVGTSSNVFQVDAQSNRMHLIYHTRSYLSICAGERGELWLIDPCNIRQTDSLYHTIRTISTGQKGMVCFSVQTTDNKMWVTQENRFTGIDLHTGKIYRPTETIKEPITYITTYDDHTIVLKTHTQWLITDTRTKALRAAASLGETDIHQVTNIYRDASHNLWIGYYNSGFEVVNPYRSLLQQHNANPLTTLTAGNRIACLAYSNGLLWCGTYSDVFCYDVAKHNYQVISQDKLFPENKIFTQLLRKIVVSGNRTVLLTHGSVVLADIVGKRLVPRFNYRNHGYLGDCVMDDSLIYVTSNQGFQVIKHDASSKKVQMPDESFGNDSRLLLLNPLRVLIITRGLHFYVYDARNGKLEKIPINGSTEGGGMPMAIVKTGKKVWIGTNGDGLFSLDLSTRQLRPYPSTAGLHVMSMAAYGQHLLISTRLGMGIVNTSSGETQLYDITLSKGKPYELYSANSIAIVGDDCWLGSAYGCVAVPRQITSQKQAPSLYISGLYTMRGEKRYSVVMDSTMMSGRQEIVLNHRDDHLSIAFSGAGYESCMQVVYQYKMMGYDDQWTTRQQPGSITYANLPAGTYHFHLRVLQAPHGSVLGERSLIIRVKPAPAASTPAVALYAFLVLALVVYINRLYLKIRTNRLQLEQEKSEKQRIEQSDEMNRSFFANISHEFRNPLTLIYGPLSTINNDKTLPRETRRSLSVITRGVKSMLRFTDQMLDFNKLEKDALRLSVVQTDVMERLRKLADTLREGASYKHISVETSGLKGNVFGWLDNDKLEKILGNLFTDAINHTEENGLIDFSASIIDSSEVYNPTSLPPSTVMRYLKLTVMHSGKEIPDNRLADVFLRYYELPEAHKADSYSWDSGIGRYYVKRLAELHHGTVRVRNVEGKGVAFDVVLPIDESAYPNEAFTVNNGNPSPVIEEAEQAPKALDDISRQNNLAGKPVILVIESDVELAQYIRSLLQEDYIVFNKYNTEDAWAEMDIATPDIILSDIQAGQSSEIDFVSNLRQEERWAFVPVAMFVGKTNIGLQATVLEAGANVCIEKPFDGQYLRKVVASLLHNSQRMKQAAQMIGRTPALANDGMSQADRRFLDEVYKLMDKHLADSDLRVTVLARELLISPAKFNYRLKNLTGETPGNFFRTYKLQKAARLLRDSDLSINEIAVRTGFATASYFSALFKRKYKQSPSEYRNG